MATGVHVKILGPAPKATEQTGEQCYVVKVIEAPASDWHKVGDVLVWSEDMMRKGEKR